MNAIFCPALYDVEDYDPAYEDRERARKRAIEKRKAKQLAIRKAKMKKQKQLGICAVILAAICFIVGVMVPVVTTELCTAGTFIMGMAMLPLFAKKPIL